jgi:hypothetical protein
MNGGHAPVRVPVSPTLVEIYQTLANPDHVDFAQMQRDERAPGGIEQVVNDYLQSHPSALPNKEGYEMVNGAAPPRTAGPAGNHHGQRPPEQFVQNAVQTDHNFGATAVAAAAAAAATAGVYGVGHATQQQQQHQRHPQYSRGVPPSQVNPEMQRQAALADLKRRRQLIKKLKDIKRKLRRYGVDFDMGHLDESTETSVLEWAHTEQMADLNRKQNATALADGWAGMAGVAASLNSYCGNILGNAENWQKSMKQENKKFCRIMEGVSEELFPEGGTFLTPLRELALATGLSFYHHVNGIAPEDEDDGSSLPPSSSSSGGARDDVDMDSAKRARRRRRRKSPTPGETKPRNSTRMVPGAHSEIGPEDGYTEYTSLSNGQEPFGAVDEVMNAVQQFM